jgi:cell division protein FtsW (lipid II flippase)
VARRTSPGAERPNKTPSQNPPDASRSRKFRFTELGLLALAWIITSAFYVLASLGAQGEMPPRFAFFLGGVVLITLLMHFAILRYAPNSSEILLPIATLLNGIGYVEIVRWDPPLAKQQAFWYLISAIGLVLTLKFVRHVRDLDRYRYLTLVAALILLVAPLVPKIGTTINGARLWIDVGPISIEPVEFAKILLVFFFASYFAGNREMLSTPTQRLGGRTFVPPKVLVPIFAAWGISVVVLGAENDLGFAILIFALFVSLLWVATGLKSYVALGLGLLIGGAFIADKLFSQVQVRVSEWLDPWSAVNLSHSVQLAWGWFAIAGGGVIGTGLGLAPQSTGNIPFITSDMIFATVAQELGFIGVILVLCLYGSFVGEGFRIAQRATSDFVRLTAAGLSALLGFQAFFIMAGVLRLLPFTGITLPFMAYGGNSLIANYLIVAILLRISDEGNTERRGGEIVAVHLTQVK